MTHRGCGCCSDCKIFDLGIDNLQAFNDGITYSAGGTFDGWLAPGETITAKELIDGRGEKGLYRVFADLQYQLTTPTEPSRVTWIGPANGYSVTVRIPWNGPPDEGLNQWFGQFKFTHPNWSATECLVTPPGGTQRQLWTYGQLFGSGYLDYEHTPSNESLTYGEWEFVLQVSEPQEIIVHQVDVVFPDSVDDTEFANAPMQVIMEAKNIDDDGSGWSRWNLETNPAQICDEDLLYNEEPYRAYQTSEQGLSLTGGAGFAEPGAIQPGFSEGEGSRKTWIGDSAFFKAGDLTQPYESVSTDPWSFTPKTKYTFIPQMEVKTWEDEIGSEASPSSSLEGVTAGQAPLWTNPLLPLSGEMVDLEVSITNRGTEPILVNAWNAYQTQGADPSDDFECPDNTRPTYPALNPDCERWNPPCDLFGSELRFKDWEVSPPQLPTSIPGVSFDPKKHRSDVFCDPRASSRCGISQTNSNISTETLAYASEFPTYETLLRDYRTERELFPSGYELPCDPNEFPPGSGPKSVHSRDWHRDTYLGNFTAFQETDILSGSPSQSLGWDFSASFAWVPGSGFTRVTISGSLRLWYWTHTRIVSGPGGGLGAYTLYMEHDLYTDEISRQDPTFYETFDYEQLDTTPFYPNDPSPPPFANPGEFTWTRFSADLKADKSPPNFFDFSLPSFEFDICDLVPGLTIDFEVPSSPANQLQIAGPWSMSTDVRPLSAGLEETNYVDDYTECGGERVEVGPLYNSLRGQAYAADFWSPSQFQSNSQTVDFSGVSISMVLG